MLPIPSPLTTASAARRAGRCETTIRSWVRSGRLRPVAVTAGGIRLFSPADVDKALEEQSEK